MCMTCAVCGTYVLYHADSGCAGEFRVFIVLYICVCSVHMYMFVCCVHFNETVAHTSTCRCRDFTLL